jgi:hypothetical protein
MVSIANDNLTDALRTSPFSGSRLAVRPWLHPPCPGCGSGTVRSRDGRELCLICGYLQAQA